MSTFYVACICFWHANYNIICTSLYRTQQQQENCQNLTQEWNFGWYQLPWRHLVCFLPENRSTTRRVFESFITVKNLYLSRHDLLMTNSKKAAMQQLFMWCQNHKQQKKTDYLCPSSSKKHENKEKIFTALMQVMPDCVCVWPEFGCDQTHAKTNFSLISQHNYTRTFQITNNNKKNWTIQNFCHLCISLSFIWTFAAPICHVAEEEISIGKYYYFVCSHIFLYFACLE